MKEETVRIAIAERRSRIDFLKLSFREWILLDPFLDLNQALPILSPAILAIEKPIASNMATSNISGIAMEKSLEVTTAVSMPKNVYLIRRAASAKLKIPGMNKPIIHSYRTLVLIKNEIL